MPSTFPHLPRLGLSLPRAEGCLRRLRLHIVASLVADQRPIGFDHYQCGDAAHPILLRQRLDPVAPEWDVVPVAVSLIHVGLEVLGGAVERHEDDFEGLAGGIRHLLVEVLQHRGELAARWAPVRREIKCNQLALQGVASFLRLASALLLHLHIPVRSAGLSQSLRVPGANMDFGDLPMSIQEIIDIGAESLLIGRYSVTAVYVVQVYDWLLLLDDEWELIHQARWTSVKAAYLFCRYYPLLVFPVYMWAWLGDHTEEVCDKIIHPLYAFLVPFHLCPQAVILMRTYAFTGRSKYVLAMLLSAYLAFFSAYTWLFGSQFIVIKDLYLLFGNSACFANDKHAEDGQAFSSKRGVRTGLVTLGSFLLDVLMMGVIFVHCLRIRSTQGSLGRTFLKQGLGVFVVMSALNLLVASIYLGQNRQFDGVGIPFLMVLSPILVCRLVLKLRRTVSPSETEELRQQSCLVREAFEACATDGWA